LGGWVGGGLVLGWCWVGVWRLTQTGRDSNCGKGQSRRGSTPASPKTKRSIRRAHLHHQDVADGGRLPQILVRLHVAVLHAPQRLRLLAGAAALAAKRVADAADGGAGVLCREVEGRWMTGERRGEASERQQA
jgi:hypothetical protein